MTFEGECLLKETWRALQKARWCDRYSGRYLATLQEQFGDDDGVIIMRRMFAALDAADDPLAMRLSPERERAFTIRNMFGLRTEEAEPAHPWDWDPGAPAARRDR